MDSEPEAAVDSGHHEDLDRRPEHMDSEPEDGFYDNYDAETDASPVYAACTYKNGRRYQNFRNGCYPIPNDAEESRREDCKHMMLVELCGKLFYAPIGKNPQSILDIGTGNGELNTRSIALCY